MNADVSGVANAAYADAVYDYTMLMGISNLVYLVLIMLMLLRLLMLTMYMLMSYSNLAYLVLLMSVLLLRPGIFLLTSFPRQP